MDKLAILGGTKAVVESSAGVNDWPLYGDEELAEVKRVLLSPDYGGFYAEMGLLEQELKDYFNVEYALTCVNGTAALHSAMFALGVGAGDEVIVPSYAYWATCLCALCANALPVFADIDPSTLNIDPADIERKITKRTKAIVALHLWGNPCAMETIMAMAHERDLKVVGDCSHAHGAMIGGKHVGTIEDIGCFSMQASKLLPAIEGGFLLTGNRGLYERALALGHYGRLGGTGYSQYDNTCLGYKYRIHPLTAAIARVQLRKLRALNERRNGNIEHFRGKIKGLPGVAEHRVEAGARRVYYGFRLRYAGEELGDLPLDSFIAALRAEGVEAGAERYSAKHTEPLFAAENVFDHGYPWNLGEPWREPRCPPASLPRTQEALSSVIALPTFQRAGEALLDQYGKAFQKVCLRCHEIPRDLHVGRSEVDGSRAALR